MKTNIKRKIITGVIIVILAIVAYFVGLGLGKLSKGDPVFGGSSAWKRTTYSVTDGTAYHEVYSGPVTLDRIIVGKTDANASLNVFDGVLTTSSSSANPFTFGAGVTQGSYDIGMDFEYGILDTTSSTLQAVFIYTPK